MVRRRETSRSSPRCRRECVCACFYYFYKRWGGGGVGRGKQNKMRLRFTRYERTPGYARVLYDGAAPCDLALFAARPARECVCVLTFMLHKIGEGNYCPLEQERARRQAAYAPRARARVPKSTDMTAHRIVTWRASLRGWRWRISGIFAPPRNF